MSTVQVEISSTTRLFPKSHKASSESVRQRLSIIDASAAVFTPTGAIWYYDTSTTNTFDPSHLRTSLRAILDNYPQFAGRLRVAHRRDEESQRTGQAFCNRLEVWYNDAGDPGVEFVVASSEARIADLVPSPAEQASNTVWEAGSLPKEETFVQGSLADGLLVPEAVEIPGATDDPVMIVQVTSMACGGIVLGVKISHPLADAHTLGFFAREWSQAHLAIQNGATPSASEAIFEPNLLDSAADKALIGNTHQSVVEKALSLPMHRYDWWDSDDAPFKSLAMRKPDILKDDQAAQAPLLKGQAMTWHEWDRNATVQHAVLHFSRTDLESLRRTVQIQANPGTRIPSTLDSVFAHVWQAVNRARGYSSGHECGQVYADISFGLRPRMNPPLPDGFVGSTLANMAVAMPANEACSAGDVPRMANQIRKTISTFTPDMVAAHIYGLMQELTPQRVWQVFLGRRHCLITSWVHTGVLTVDFGCGQGPRYVHPIMPAVDGCIQVIEGTPLKQASTSEKWYENGVSVNVYLNADAMQRLLKDASLHSDRK